MWTLKGVVLSDSTCQNFTLYGKEYMYEPEYTDEQGRTSRWNT